MNGAIIASKNLAREKSKVLNTPWSCGLAMAGLFGWILSFPLYGPVALKLFPVMGASLGHAFAATHGLALIFFGLFSRSWACFFVPPGGRIAALILLLLTAVSGRLSNPGLPVYFLFVLMGVAAAYLVLNWIPWFTTQAKPALCLGVVIVGANVVLYLSGLLVNLAAPDAALTGILKEGLLFLLGIMLLVGTLATEKGLKVSKGFKEGTSQDTSGCLRGTFLALAAFAVAAYVGGGIMYRELLPNVLDHWPAGGDAGLLAYCLAAIVFAPIAQRFGPPALGGISLSGLGIGLLLSTLGQKIPDLVSVSYLIVMIGEGGADLFYWLSLWTLSYYVGGIRAFGLGLGGSLLLISGTGAIVDYGLIGNPADTSLTGLLGAALIFFAVPFVFRYSLPSLKFPEPSVPKMRDGTVTGNIRTAGVSAGLPAQEVAVTADVQHDLLGVCFQDELTPTERKVFTLLINGLNDTEMAEELFVSRHTIKFHVRNILRKAEVKNRKELLALLLSRENGDD